MIRLFLTATLLAAAAAPAAAEDFAWHEANDAYQVGLDSDETPSSHEDELTCGAFWTVWGTTIGGGHFSEADMEGLRAELRPEFADIVSLAYVPEIADGDTAAEEEFNAYLADASASFDAFLEGSKEAGGAFFATLGMCTPRDGGQ